MIKQFVRLAIVATVWRRYKGSILSVLALLLFWFAVSFFHGEYISYAEATGERQHLAISFFIKWGLGIGALSLFVLFHLGWLSKASEPEQSPEPEPSQFEKVKAKAKEKVADLNGEPEVPPAPKPGDEAYKTAEDPFASLRDKPKLRSRGDVELAKQKNS
ncbi:hypothetical protein [uncultured Pseudoteredinibacter sp.]|uniref:hypothetical protein n=1 Tax=uncultured Pseudoteredinibacter sp. TaxID=1641701 RepID=UPI002634B049|nr:hypothetical protein [uncultured Pseudoteredinibacter sp.]